MKKTLISSFSNALGSSSFLGLALRLGASRLPKAVGRIWSNGKRPRWQRIQMPKSIFIGLNDLIAWVEGQISVSQA